ncbi:MAG: hypothetical protein M1831_004555 [Alyxoria varia]|nr:MAG: hypothetical protein M1831_004555 [Alyxoria varia]
MFNQFSSPAVVAAVAAFVPMALAANGPVIPCATGYGKENGCGYCQKNASVELGSWKEAKRVDDFTLEGAESKTGAGYDVYWNVPHIDDGCRVILTQPFLQDEHEPELSGNVILTTKHTGCFYAHVGSQGFSAAYCCGNGDCESAGAGGTVDVKKRSSPLERRRQFAHSKDQDKKPQPVKRGCWGGKCDAPPEAPEGPQITCSKAEPSGDPYTKAGKQEVDGNTLSCNGGEACGLMPAISVSVSDTVTNEHSTTITQSNGKSISATAGWQWLGPTATVTAGYNEEWSEAVGDSTSTSTDTAHTKTLTLNVQIMPGSKYNLWFTPTLNCQKMKMKCNDEDVEVEKCTPALNGEGNPEGEHGVMTIG